MKTHNEHAKTYRQKQTSAGMVQFNTWVPAEKLNIIKRMINEAKDEYQAEQDAEYQREQDAEYDAENEAHFT
jgi:hypothetical protein